MPRLPVLKTCKLFIRGAFVRSESGRSLPVTDHDGATLAHLCRASRKDLRDAVAAARDAAGNWAAATPYNRAQILYRLAEMLEGKRADLQDALARVPAPPVPPTPALAPSDETDLAIDRAVAFAGWADKLHHVLGCANPVAGPYHNFTVPEPVGVVAAVAPDAPPLLAACSLILPALAAGSTVVLLAPPPNPLPAAILAEALATSDLPPGACNILTGLRDELIPHIAAHRNIDAVLAVNLPGDHAAKLRLGSAENLKRVHTTTADLTSPDCHSPDWLLHAVELKTVWHPAAF